MDSNTIKLLKLIFLINKIDTLAMAAWYLVKLRRAETFNIEVPKQDMSALLGGGNKTQGSSFNNFHKKQNLNPFAGRANPFARRR